MNFSRKRKSLVVPLHLTHRGKRFCKVGGKKYFKFSLAPYNIADGRIAKRGERKICGGSHSAEFGEGTPQQDHHKGENEQSAKFGTVVESCSNNFRYPLNGAFSKPFTLQRTKSAENLIPFHTTTDIFSAKYRVRKC